ncbi:MAG: hypothetical protein K2G53_08640, partial [Muribaculaceae bacterium]|nr:hypothetical protein [Muribaculaceae bacterium]
MIEKDETPIPWHLVFYCCMSLSWDVNLSETLYLCGFSNVKRDGDGKQITVRDVITMDISP